MNVKPWFTARVCFLSLSNLSFVKVFSMYKPLVTKEPSVKQCWNKFSLFLNFLAIYNIGLLSIILAVKCSAILSINLSYKSVIGLKNPEFSFVACSAICPITSPAFCTGLAVKLCGFGLQH